MIDEVQKAVVSLLGSDTELTGLVGSRVYGTPPVDAEYPLIRFGRIAAEPDETDGDKGVRVTFTVEVHDRPKTGGRIKTAQIVTRIRELMNWTDSLSPTGLTLWYCHVINYNITEGADGLGYIGIIAVELRIMES